jgi:hypothetical protein
MKRGKFLFEGERTSSNAHRFKKEADKECLDSKKNIKKSWKMPGRTLYSHIERFLSLYPKTNSLSLSLSLSLSSI